MQKRRIKMIKHIVMWKFKEGTEEKQKEFLAGLRGLLGVIPEIKSLAAAENSNPKANYDAVLITEFETMDDLEKYQNDPRHIAVASICREIATERAAVDFEM